MALVLALATGAASAATDATGTLVTVSLSKSVPGTFYAAGSLPGYGDVDFLVDTGSSFTVINADILEKLLESSRAKFERNLEGHMADGSKRIVPLFTIDGLSLGGDCLLENVEVAVMPGNTRPILGMNLLSRLAPFKFSANPPSIEFSTCDALPAGVASN